MNEPPCRPAYGVRCQLAIELPHGGFVAGNELGVLFDAGGRFRFEVRHHYEGLFHFLAG
jgi:hypothetical protein